MKQDLITLRAYLVAILKVWDNSYYTTLEVLLQNMIAHDDIDEDETYCRDILKCFKALHEHRIDDHVVDTAYSELSMIVVGHFMNKAEQEMNTFTSALRSTEYVKKEEDIF